MLPIIFIIVGLWLIFGGFAYGLSLSHKLKPWAGVLFAIIGLILFFTGNTYLFAPDFF